MLPRQARVPSWVEVLEEKGGPGKRRGRRPRCEEYDGKPEVQDSE